MKKPFPVQENPMSQWHSRQTARPSIPRRLRCDGNKTLGKTSYFLNAKH